MLNKIIVMGRLCKDPEMRRTNSGSAVTSFTIACDRDFATNGEKETDFLEIVCWKNTAEFVSKYFAKGRMAVVSGRLQIRSWTDKDGNKRRTAEIVADNVYFGDSKKESSGGDSYGNSYGGYNAPGNPAPGSDFAPIDEEDSQLPF